MSIVKEIFSILLIIIITLSEILLMLMGGSLFVVLVFFSVAVDSLILYDKGKVCNDDLV